MTGAEFEQPLFKVKFEDNSEFILPKEWEEIFVEYYGTKHDTYPSVAERLKFVTGKYIANSAWPTKYDGIQFEDYGSGEVIPDKRYNDPKFYMAKWDNLKSEDSEVDIPITPKWADVAEAVMYQNMRGGFFKWYTDQLIKELENQKAS